MPVNVAMTFLIGGILGWIVVKLLRPKPHLEGLVIATCASGQLNYIHLFPFTPKKLNLASENSTFLIFFLSFFLSSIK